MIVRVTINREISNSIAKPLRSHKQVLELSEPLDLLLGMKERGAYYRAYNDDMAIHIVNSQFESKTAAPFAAEQSHVPVFQFLVLRHSSH